MDDGRMTDGLGRTVDFRRVILIMTSNTGFNVGAQVGFQDVSRDVQRPLKNIFTPEFLDRLDEVIAFETFDEHGILHITNQMLDDIREDLAQRDVQVSFSPEVASFLVSKMPKGDSARPMRSVMREHIEDPLSLEILQQGSGEPIVIAIEDDKVVFARPVAIA